MGGLRWVTLAAALVGCEPMTYSHPTLTEVEEPNSDAALDVLASYYGSEFGIELPASEITWVLERIPYGGSSVIGMSYGCESATITHFARVSDSALAHEIGHCARQLATGDSDHDHLDESWWGLDGVVRTAQGRLAEAGF